MSEINAETTVDSLYDKSRGKGPRDSSEPTPHGDLTSDEAAYKAALEVLGDKSVREPFVIKQAKEVKDYWELAQKEKVGLGVRSGAMYPKMIRTSPQEQITELA